MEIFAEVLHVESSWRTFKISEIDDNISIPDKLGYRNFDLMLNFDLMRW
jgi:hypothetical protein